MSEFGLTFEQATHRPWDPFSSMDNAAIAFGLMYTQEATDINREIGAYIYSVTTGRRSNRSTHYSFGLPWIGMHNNVIFGLIVHTLFYEFAHPIGASPVALVHTHPRGDRNFSSQDRSLAHGVYNILGLGIPGMPIFLSVNLTDEQGGGMEVRRFDDSMNLENRGGELIFSK